MVRLGVCHLQPNAYKIRLFRLFGISVWCHQFLRDEYGSFFSMLVPNYTKAPLFCSRREPCPPPPPQERLCNYQLSSCRGRTITLRITTHTYIICQLCYDSYCSFHNILKFKFKCQCIRHI